MQIEARRALHGIPSRSSAAEPTSENAAIAMKKTDVISPASPSETSNSLRDRRRGRPDHAGAVAEARAEQDDADSDARRRRPGHGRTI